MHFKLNRIRENAMGNKVLVNVDGFGAVGDEIFDDSNNCVLYMCMIFLTFICGRICIYENIYVNYYFLINLFDCLWMVVYYMFMNLTGMLDCDPLW